MNVAKYIKFDKLPESENHEHRPQFEIVNKRTNDWLGKVYWYRPWKRYVAQFDGQTVWSADCLQDVAAYLDAINGKQATP
jgi:hypothetical protein